MNELLAAWGIIINHETVRPWTMNFGQDVAHQIRCRLPRTGHLNFPIIVAIKGRHIESSALGRSSG